MYTPFMPAQNRGNLKKVELFSHLFTPQEKTTKQTKKKTSARNTQNTVILHRYQHKAKYNYNNLKASHKPGNSSFFTAQIDKNSGIVCNEMYDKL